MAAPAQQMLLSGVAAEKWNGGVQNTLMLRRQEDPSLSSVLPAEEAKCVCWKLGTEKTQLYLVIWAGTHLCAVKPKNGLW